MARITSPHDESLSQLCASLRELAPTLNAPQAWPAKQLELCAAAGVHEWFLPPEVGGQGWSEADLLRGYLQLSAACLTTAFVITQRVGACTRIAASGNVFARQKLLPSLIDGQIFATVGISHLTTSRQHMQPVMRAEETSSGFKLTGYSPWVTGAEHAQSIVLGATLVDGRQILVALPTDLPGVRIPPAPELVSLTASRTGEVHCDEVLVNRQWLLGGPIENVMKQGLGAKTGGLQTSTLAAGLTTAALDYLEQEAQQRNMLAEPATAMRAELNELIHDLLALAEGEQPCAAEDARGRANSLSLRATQAALVAAKGAGFVATHSAGRWCREALFFLVWSCPQNVLAVNLCEFAGLH
ncbi:Glutaryl-CoA dehydrogenase [Anatilimnocola aggregata]|uniref:Glutaryl-CoA dehydrogenase n=1 Tax=Anatilimnocola aggregata TaxID=2528021 RepID=A0A517YLX9_9BACT|nr:acyl-CoA dehydrogenase family protein [Anatilimnocola aggregata]QDU31228.1 Glutaryl-CoA dehydrogenase [Anatilimnocola aggregata]